jgi:hypothetical protein
MKWHLDGCLGIREMLIKIGWRIKNPDRFCFIDRPIIFYMGKASILLEEDHQK